MDDYAHIIEGCRRNDRKAQRALYDAFAPMAMGVCMRYAHNRTAAQDLMQDGFVKVYERLGQVHDADSLGAWIYKLMVNECLMHFRLKKMKWKEECLDNGLDSLSASDLQLSTFDDPFAMEEVVLAIERLTPSQRLVFNLVEVEGYTFEEVARRLKSSESNVRALLSRAKSMLRKILTDSPSATPGREETWLEK